MSLPTVDLIHQSIDRLKQKLKTVDSESLPLAESAGRILAAELMADRDSPALDVSAMDGYAVRLEDLQRCPTLPVIATSAAGAAPIELAPNSAIRIFTGAPIPKFADCVIKREDTLESPQEVQIKLSPDQWKPGLHIRSRGENTRKGVAILDTGTQLHPAAMSAIASFGAQKIDVRRRINVTILNTGDELAPPGSPVQPWQIRDSNGPLLAAFLDRFPWIQKVGSCHVGDTLQQVEHALAKHIEKSDAVVLTGGVSMGDTDYVPQAIENLGGEIEFHRLPIRPGKPVLGASLGGKLLLGLPGNPVSVAVTSRVIGLPLLEQLAGTRNSLARPWVNVQEDSSQLPLIWYRLVDCDPQGQLRFSTSKGSGDLVSLARSRGFVEIPAGQSGIGPWRFFEW